MTLKLVPPSREYKRSYREYIAELGAEERYPFSLDFEHQDFTALLEHLGDFAKGINVPDGYVPSSTYWLIEAGNIAGVSSLRHCLNERIRQCGGHIGLGIRPSRRGRGLGSALMALTIQEARGKVSGDIHIHCHKGNEASVRMILANGGILDSEIEHGQPPVLVQRYLVPVSGRDAT